MTELQRTGKAVHCPLNNIMWLRDCEKCPYYEGYESWRQAVKCGYEDERMKAEKAVRVEPIAPW